MKSYKSVLFSIFLILYGVGVCIGSVRQVSIENQSSMYEYLEGAVSGYNVPIKESITSIFNDNMKLFLFLFIGGFFIVGPVVLGAVMLLKGYSTGFAITAVLRLFGIGGFTFCTANLISAAIMVPSLCWYSYKAVVNIQENRYDRREFLKRFFVLSVLMLALLVIDSGVRGFLSAILMKLAPNG